MVEEGEREDQAARRVGNRKAAVADTVDEGEVAGFELLARRHGAEGFEVGRLAGGGRGRDAGGTEAVLDADAVIGEGVVALAIVALEPGEIGVGNRDEIVAGCALCRVDFGQPARVERRSIEHRRPVAKGPAEAEGGRAGHNCLDLALGHAQGHDRAGPAFGQSGETGGLPGVGIEEGVAVRTDAVRGRPQPFADRQGLAVFGVAPTAVAGCRLGPAGEIEHLVEQRLQVPARAVHIPPGVKSKPRSPNPSHSVSTHESSASRSVERMTKLAPVFPSRKNG